jgi:hypothetical protein
MSSETSTKQVRVKADAVPDPGLQPWQFFVLAALGCATAVTFIARGQGPAAIILLSILMATAALVGYAVLRMVRPLMSTGDDRTVMIGQRTRVALEREKMLALRSIKELEFDRAMGRLSDEDWKEMSGRLRIRAARLIRQLDAGVGYRQQIEQELEKRLAGGNARLKPPSREDGADADGRSAKANDGSAKVLVEREDSDDRSATLREPQGRPDPRRGPKTLAERACASCDTLNDADARFCKGCGAKL